MTTNLKSNFKSKVYEWALKLNVRINSIAMRPMINKWASCSTNGNLNFNTDLLMLEKELWDYVIVHELLHLSIPNHGKLWKTLMRVHLGEWENYEKKLKRSFH